MSQPLDELRKIGPPLVWPVCASPSQPVKQPPVVLTTITAGLPHAAMQCVRHNRLAYSEEHSMEYCEFNGPLASYVSWGFQKVVALAHLFARPRLHQGKLSRPLAVWYLDADALIMNFSISIHALLDLHRKELVWASEPSTAADGSSHAMREFNKVLKHHVELPLPAGQRAWTIQGGSFAARNTSWVRATLAHIYSLAGSTRGYGPSHKPHSNNRSLYSDRLAWILWTLEHPAEAEKRMALLRSDVFDSMWFTYVDGDFVYHVGGGGARGYQEISTAKYEQLHRVCSNRSRVWNIGSRDPPPRAPM
mmetsp:Transcript_8380/g.26203  ORF Transcript_8380/g.26203 Transcript_8380/m.26203 type:complete len:306 (+) Transcript_8380:55-972(+)